MGTKSGKQKPDTFTGVGGKYRREFKGGPRIMVSAGTVPAFPKGPEDESEKDRDRRLAKWNEKHRTMEGSTADFLDGSTAHAAPDIQPAE